MYIPKHFELHELLPPKLYDMYKEDQNVGWRLLDERLLITLDSIKEKFPLGSMTVNNYYWGGSRRWSGLRTPNAGKYYSVSSQHTYGRAADIVFTQYSEDYVRQYLIDNHEDFPYIKGIEDNVSWVHIDCRNSNLLVVFNA